MLEIEELHYGGKLYRLFDSKSRPWFAQRFNEESNMYGFNTNNKNTSFYKFKCYLVKNKYFD